jgi:hypothetical protein
MKFVETLKGDSSSLETNHNILENIFHVWLKKKSSTFEGGSCHTAGVDHTGQKICPSSEDFVTQRTSTKCGPKICPSSEDFVTLWTSTKCGPKMCPSSEYFVRVGNSCRNPQDSCVFRSCGTFFTGIRISVPPELFRNPLRNPVCMEPT